MGLGLLDFERPKTIYSLFFLQVVAVGKKAERRGALHVGPIQLTFI